MKPITTTRGAFLGIISAGMIALPAVSLEIVTEEDLIQGIITTEQLVRVADNAIFLMDTSSSMNDPYGDTGKSKLEMVTSVFTQRNTYFPEIGHKFGIYIYTPWKELYAAQTYDRAKIAAALAGLPKKGSGPTRLTKGLESLRPILKKLSGRTAIFVFSDGGYTGNARPINVASQLARAYDVCFYVVSTASEMRQLTMMKRVAHLNSCSRTIALSDFINRPEYTTGALYDVVATEEIVTATETRIVGVKVNPMQFEFDKDALKPEEKAELDALGRFMNEKPEAFAVIAGYTDNLGNEGYNEGLSERRAKMVADYLMDNHNIDASRIVVHWYGSDNPRASNDTPEGRAQNRRVEVAVGGV